MKGRTIQKLLRILTPKEFEEFLLYVKSYQPSVPEFLPFSRLLIEKDYSESLAIESLGVQKRVKNYRLEALGETLVRFFLQSGSESQILGMIEASKKLALNLESDTSIEILKPAMIAAERIERFDLLVKCWQILSMNDNPNSIDCISERECYKNIQIIAELHSLLLRIPIVRGIESLSERNRELAQIRSQSLEVFRKDKLGQRGMVAFLRIQARVGAILADETDWIKSQEAVIAQLEAHPWVSYDYELELAQETRRLTQLYWQYGRRATFWKRFDQFSEMRFSCARAGYEQIVSRFPFLFAAAIEKGSYKLGINAFEEFSALLEKGDLATRPKHLSISLYFCAYFLFVSREHRDAKRILFRIMKLPKNSILPSVYFASHFLQIAFELEENEFESADRLIRNLSNVTKIPMSPGTDELLKAFRSISKSGSVRGEIDWNSTETEISELLLSLHGKDAEAYFQLKYWIQSKKDGRPMLQYFEQEAAMKIES